MRDAIALMVVAYVLSWIVWGSVIAQDNGKLSFHIPQTLAFWFLALGVPILAFTIGGRDGVTDLVRRLLRWRVNPVWYVVALVVPVALALVAAAAAAVLGQDVPVGVKEPLGSAVGYFLFGIFFFGLTEETAWRGFLLPRLQLRMDALTAAVVVGVIWGVWHAPLWFITGEDQQAWPFVGFLVFAIAESVLITWVFNSAGGSVLLAAIFHAATDAGLAFSGVLYGSTAVFWIAVVVFVLAAAGVVAIAGAGRLSSSSQPIT